MTASDLDLIKETFLRKYRCDVSMPGVSVAPGFLLDARGASELFAVYSGASFEGGLYRFLRVEKISEWTQAACAAFPQFAGRIQCFSSDWLGRLFALDSQREVDEQPGVLMLEPGMAKALEIPANFLTFHCSELIEFADAAIARETYVEWHAKNMERLQGTECVGYKVPPFLGGADAIDNMERTDMRMYWDLCAQLIQQIRSLPEGTKIQKVSL